ncbi:hypothetical protein G7Z17_g1347 [Cylindrodendrum hubeiense]|uniref:Solute-binding protein family 5 domain-containing protein n=1 Tax=Cylindrodendrum hubeiense TaxID=595255 RepID=A0A9P5HN08_9HYPO|nr:hypothetical protein G7Z17_g1347 [Cylindrodendrum hubeiense]
MKTSTLRISLEKVDFRQPTQVTDDSSVLTLKNCVFEPLLKWQPGGLAHPALFDRWEHSPSGCEWHFYIRDGAVFHDGVVCEAGHIVEFIHGILNSRDTFGMRWSYHRYLARANITAINGRTVRVENPEPIAAILDIFTELYICRVSVDGKPILGTGRYRVVEFDKEKGRTVLEYAGSRGNSQSPQPSAEERFRKLSEGKIDVALNLERLEKPPDFLPNLQWGRATNTLSVIYYLNCQNGIFTSPNARLAVNHAVDTAALALDVFNGLAIPSATIVSPFHLGSQKASLEPIPYDLSEAKRLLEGIDLSRPITLRTPEYMPDRAEAITSFVVSSLEAVGFKVTVEVEQDRAAYARQVGLEKEIGDLALFDSSPHSTYRVLDDKISSVTRAVWWQGYEDVKVDKLIKVANDAVEDRDRQIAYSQCLERLRQNPPWLYLVHPIEVFAARLHVQGLNLDCKGVLNIA